MSKKKLLEFGLKEADAFQKNFKIIFNRLVKGYKSMMGKDPEGLDLLKVKMEAREKAINTTKIVNQKGLTLDPDKPIVGGTQEGIETIKIKELDDFNLSKDDPMGDFKKIVKGEGDTSLPKKKFPRDVIDEEGVPDTMTQKEYNESGIKSEMEEALGVRLYGDESYEELMKIKETGVHPRGEPPIKKADGGRVGFALGGESIIGKDIGMIGGLMGGPTTEDDDFSSIEGQTAGIGLSSLLGKVFGPTIGKFMHAKIKNKAIDKIHEINKKKQRDKAVQQAQINQTIAMAAANKSAGRGGYQAGYDSGFMDGPAGAGTGMGASDKGGSDSMGSHADGGLITMFVEKR